MHRVMISLIEAVCLENKGLDTAAPLSIVSTRIHATTRSGVHLQLEMQGCEGVDESLEERHPSKNIYVLQNRGPLSWMFTCFGHENGLCILSRIPTFSRVGEQVLGPT